MAWFRNEENDPKITPPPSVLFIVPSKALAAATMNWAREMGVVSYMFEDESQAAEYNAAHPGAKYRAGHIRPDNHKHPFKLIQMESVAKLCEVQGVFGALDFSWVLIDEATLVRSHFESETMMSRVAQRRSMEQIACRIHVADRVFLFDGFVDEATLRLFNNFKNGMPTIEATVAKTTEGVLVIRNTYRSKFQEIRVQPSFGG